MRETRRISIRLPTGASEWTRAIRDITDDLREAVSDMGLEGKAARVLYRSPTQSVDLSSFDLRSGAEACSAAALTVADALPYNVGSAIIRTLAVGRDRAGSSRRMHVVVAADRSDVVRTIVDLIERSGLVFESACPLDAPILASLLRQTLKDTGPRRGWLYCGENSSFFIIGGEGSVSFQRVITIGTRTVVQALTRPIRLPGGDEMIELNLATAEKILYTRGIPETDEKISEDPELTRRHIMPLIQPALQRFVVELRQSLRFGVSDERERSSMKITMAGPGSTIPGFSTLLGWELHQEIKVDESSSSFDYRSPASAGSELMMAFATPDVLRDMNFQPPDKAHRREVKRLKQWLWVGGGTAILAVAIEVGTVEYGIASAQSQAEIYEIALRSIDSSRERQEKMLAALEDVRELNETVRNELGTASNIAGIMHELAVLTPPTIRFSSIRFKRVGAVMKGNISGRVSPNELGRWTDLDPFIDALRKSPLVQNVDLQNVEGGTSGRRADQRFDVIFDLTSLPDTRTLAVHDKTGEGS